MLKIFYVIFLWLYCNVPEQNLIGSQSERYDVQITSSVLSLSEFFCNCHINPGRQSKISHFGFKFVSQQNISCSQIPLKWKLIMIKLNLHIFINFLGTIWVLMYILNSDITFSKEGVISKRWVIMERLLGLVLLMLNHVLQQNNIRLIRNCQKRIKTSTDFHQLCDFKESNKRNAISRMTINSV